MKIEAVRSGFDHHYPLSGCSNLGLMVDRLTPKVEYKGPGETAVHECKNQALERMQNFRMSDDNGYSQALARFERAVEAVGHCDIFDIRTTGRCLLGTGNASVFEFGCRLNRPWGVPYIPGSSLKGLLSAWLAHQYGKGWERFDNSRKSDAQVELFGGIRKDSSVSESYAGLLCFHDAWLVPSGQNLHDGWFTKDILTPHHQRYARGEALPSGMDDPMPIPMAPLGKGLCFRVMIQGPEGYRRFARAELLEALKAEGIGGKTAVGYGRFDYVLTEKEQNDQISDQIGKADTAEELESLYNAYKHLSFTGPLFRQAIDRIPFDPLLERAWAEFAPLSLLYRDVQDGRVRSLRALNNRYNQLRNGIFAWLSQWGDKPRLNQTRDGKMLFDLILKKWPEEVQGSSGNVVSDLSYGWEEVASDPDTLAAYIESDQAWPPLRELDTFLTKNVYGFDSDDIELLRLMLQEKDNA